MRWIGNKVDVLYPSAEKSILASIIFLTESSLKMQCMTPQTTYSPTIFCLIATRIVHWVMGDFFLFVFMMCLEGVALKELMFYTQDCPEPVTDILNCYC